MVPLALVGSLASVLSYQSAQQAARQHQAIVTRLIADDFARVITSAEDQLKVFGEPLIKSNEVFDITNDRLYPLLLSTPLFNEIGLYTLDGMLMANAFRNAPTQMSLQLDSDDMLSKVKGGQIFYTDPAPLTAGPPPVLRIALPLGEPEQPAFILLADVSMEQIWAITGEQEASTGSRTMITTADGRLISAKDEQTIRDQLSLVQTALFSDPAGSEVIIKDYESPLGGAVLGTRTTIKIISSFPHSGGNNHDKVVQMFQDIYAAGYRNNLMGSESLYSQEFLNSAGEAADALYVTFAGIPADRLTGKGQEWYAAYKQKYNSEPHPYAVYGYDAASASLAGINSVCKKERTAIRDAIFATKDFDGALGRWSFDSNGDTTLTTMSGSQARQGTFEFVKILGEE